MYLTLLNNTAVTHHVTEGKTEKRIEVMGR